jgi:hypothetical protein
MQVRRRHFLLVAVLIAIVQLPSAAAWATPKESAADIIAAQLRRQGVACTTAQSAVRDPVNSSPHETVWTLRCNEASYRVTLVPHLGARITTMRRDDHRESVDRKGLGS